MPSPLSWSPYTTTPLSNSNSINSLLWGVNWISGALTYSFPTTSSVWSTSSTSGYGPSTGTREPWAYSSGPSSASDRTYTPQILEKWANVANLTFTQVSDTPSLVGDIRFAYTYISSHDTAAAWVAEFPGPYASAGDIWFNVYGSSGTDVFKPGTFAGFTVLHELGHALGLKHPFQASPTVNAVLPDSLDSQTYTVMSYSASINALVSDASYYPTTPMLLDIQAIQYIYGANYNYHAGNNAYTYSDAIDYRETIWDGGGIDSLNYVGTRNATIDLREGSGSQIGRPIYTYSSTGSIVSTLYNILIAYGVTIENANGGSGNDQITGNDANNGLGGGAGNDTLDGGAGIDTAIFGGKSTDYYLIKDAASMLVIPHTVSARLQDGTDALRNIEQISFLGDGITIAASGISNQTFGLSYIASNPDLIKAFGADADAGTTHYIQSGMKEGRTYSFNGLSYIASNPDLIKAFGADADVGTTHYIQSGMKEGRTYSFNGLSYIASNPDLIQAFGADADAGTTHYIQSGMKEGRTYSFNGLSYIASNPDLIKAFGADADAGTTHYIRSGMKEGRTFTFDANFYLAKNEDLRSTFGANLNSATLHYILTGSREGRSLVTSGNDKLTGSSLADVINGYSGNDTINGYGGNDTLYGGAGNDTFDFDSNSRLGSDTFYGGTGNDTYVLDSTLDSVIEYSGEGTDIIWVSFSYSIASLPYIENLRVYGSTGVTLTGNAGNNVLSGNTGNDVLIGGAGADNFYFETNQGVDRITDFNISQGDHIGIAYGTNGITTSTQALAHVYKDVNGNGVLDLGNGNSVTLTGVLASSLHASDFLIW